MNLADLTTEGRNPNSAGLDQLSALEIARLMSCEDQVIPAAVAAVEKQVAAAIDMIADRLRRGGRLIYLGAGTSGRLGVLDAAECPPTFNSPPWQVIGLIAGGTTALTRAVEGAEDHEEFGVDDLRRIECSEDDVVVGIATSGRTPYVIGGLKHARSVGAKVIGLSCNADSNLNPFCDIEIVPIVGPEVVTGSTRLKAGTATKLVLNRLTTGAMVMLGKTYGNLMVDLQATNEKLADRSERLVAELADVSREQAGQLLAACDGDVKTAILAQRRNVSAEDARQHLRLAHGRLRDALEADSSRVIPSDPLSAPGLVLGVDGGGTKTRAWLAAADAAGTDPVAVGESAAANPQAVGWAAALANIDLAINRAFAATAVARHPVAGVCLAIAGTGREADQRRLQEWTMRQRIARQILITHDALPVLSQGTTDGVGLVLISGTGSFAFGKNGSGLTARAGGWGHVLGDEGSGYGIALAGLRALVHCHDETGPATSLTRALSNRLGLQRVEDVRDFLSADRTDVRTIAALAPAIIAEADSGDAAAQQIVDESASQLALLVRSVASRLFGSTPECELAMAGGTLTHCQMLRERLLHHLAEQGMRLTQIEIVAEPIRGAILLARKVTRSGSETL